MIRNTFRFAAGAVAGLLLWIGLAAPYNALLAAIATPGLRIDERLRGLEIVASGRALTARGDATRPDLPGVVIPADQLTYNVVLLSGLFALHRAPLRDRNARRVAVALLVLFVTHVAAVAIAVEATFATRAGRWSEENFSDLAQDFWAALEYGYRLFGMFAVAFGLFWLTRERVSGASADRRSRE